MRPVALALPLTLAACVSNGGVQPLKPLEIATAPYSGVPTTALTGSLMYEGDCLLFRNDKDNAQVMPVWPDGSSFNGTAVTFHEPGKAEQRIIVSEEVMLEGHPAEWRELPGSRLPLYEKRCRREPFAVLKVHPAN
jgi:hypothetical protein